MQLHIFVDGEAVFCESKDLQRGIGKLTNKAIESLTDHGAAVIRLDYEFDQYFDMINQVLDFSHPPDWDVYIYAVSMGAGYLAPLICQYAIQRGCQIRKVIVSDPIPKFTDPENSWMATIPRKLRKPMNSVGAAAYPAIPFPPQVQKIVSFVQDGMAAGYDVEVEGHPDRVLGPVHLEGIRHIDMDNAPEFVAECESTLHEALKELLAAAVDEDHLNIFDDPCHFWQPDDGPPLSLN